MRTAIRAAGRAALLAVSLALLTVPAHDATHRVFGRRGVGGIDMSALDLEMSAGCEVGTDGCEVVQPLVTVELRSNLMDETSTPRAPVVVHDEETALVSDAFFVWLVHPPDTFWVNLAPTESDRVIDVGLGATVAGKVLLEADLLLKRTAAKLLHPDHALGSVFWDQLYGWVGTRGAKLCHSFRQWIVPGVAQLRRAGVPADAGEDSRRRREDTQKKTFLHVLRAPLRVRQESEYATGSGGFKRLAIDSEGAVREMCSGADEGARREASRLFDALILPELERSVNEWPEYELLRRVYLWRVVSEYYRSGGVDLQDARARDHPVCSAEVVETQDARDDGEDGGYARRSCSAENRNRRDMVDDDDDDDRFEDDRTYPSATFEERRREANKRTLADFVREVGSRRWRRDASDPWSPGSVWDRYVESATEGEFALTRDAENERGDVFRRTYFHGGVDWRRVRFCVDDATAGNWCEGIDASFANMPRKRVSSRGEGALSLVAGSSRRVAAA
jgi:hypothetical protein